MVLPVSLSGCDSKPAASTPVAAPASPPQATKESTAASPDVKKVAQNTVQYQGQPKADQKCGGCAHFLAESNSCQRVEGQVSPEGWCLLWMRKA
jgi:hypothetical protein